MPFRPLILAIALFAGTAAAQSYQWWETGNSGFVNTTRTATLNGTATGFSVNGGGALSGNKSAQGASVVWKEFGGVPAGVVSGDYSVTISDGVATAALNTPLIYTAHVVNPTTASAQLLLAWAKGAGTAAGMTVTFSNPTCPVSSGCYVNGQSATLLVPALSFRDVTITVTPSVATGALQITATLTTFPGYSDTNAGNNAASDVNTITP